MSWRRSARVLALVAAAVVVVMGGVALARPVLDIPIAAASSSACPRAGCS